MQNFYLLLRNCLLKIIILDIIFLWHIKLSTMIRGKSLTVMSLFFWPIVFFKKGLDPASQALLSHLIKSDPIWSDLIQSNPIQSDPIWSNLMRHDLIWSNLIQADEHCGQKKFGWKLTGLAVLFRRQILKDPWIYFSH